MDDETRELSKPVERRPRRWGRMLAGALLWGLLVLLALFDALLLYELAMVVMSR